MRERSAPARLDAPADRKEWFPAMTQAPLSESRPLDVPRDQLPRHIAIIMDGNGRWAIERQQPRVEGHRAGAQRVRDIVIECAKLGLDALTLYCFSLENWKRPPDEIGGLMDLYIEYLIKERQELLDNDVRFVQLGRREGLPEPVLAEVDETIAQTRHCRGLTLCLALNYGSRAELTDAVVEIARKVRDGEMALEQIREETVSDHLYTAGLPDPDLLIRTAGEMRVSNYLLWQISYAEIHVSPVFWPEFTVQSLHAAIRDFVNRNRRFGALDDSNS
jgi:undecaprenyl diphosphate synthase